MTRPRIHLLVDRPGWAFDITARAIVRYLSDEFAFKTDYIVAGNIARTGYDLSMVFYWAQATKIPPYRAMKQISSHRWADLARGNLTAEQAAAKYLQDAFTFIVPSQRLFDTFTPYVDVSLAPKGYDPDLFAQMRDRDGDLVIGWAGKATDPSKGLGDVLRPGIPDLRVAGGELQEVKMPAFYNGLDVICVASMAEGDPRPLIEGMACGCFPVCVDVGIVPELVRHEDNGLIVERSIGAFQRAVSWCRKHIEHVREAGRRNATAMASTRTWAHVMPAWRNAFRRALAKVETCSGVTSLGNVRFGGLEMSNDTAVSDQPILYRVRDKDYKDGKPVIVWGENLPFEAAELLKERVASEGKSYTVRVEAMTAPSPSLVTAASPPDPDPELDLVRAKALAAAHGATVAAQGRADAVARQAPPAPPINLSAQSHVTVPEIDMDEIGDAAEMPDDLGAAQAESDAQFAEYDAKGAELYESRGSHDDVKDGSPYRSAVGLPGKSKPWAELTEVERAAFRFEAANKVP